MEVVRRAYPNALINCINILPRADIRDIGRDIERLNRLLEDFIDMEVAGATWIRLFREYLDHCGCCPNLNLFARGRLHPSVKGKQILVNCILRCIGRAITYRRQYCRADRVAGS
eukprot:sb/3476842/